MPSESLSKTTQIAQPAEVIPVDLFPKMEQALIALRLGGLYTEAAKAAGVDQGTVWRWRQKYPTFATDFLAAVSAGADKLEETLYVCAHKALDDPKYQTSLIFALKCRRPDVWRDVHDVRMTGDLEIKTLTVEVGLNAVLPLLPDGGQDVRD